MFVSLEFSNRTHRTAVSAPTSGNAPAAGSRRTAALYAPDSPHSSHDPWLIPKNENPQQVEDSRTCSGYFRGSHHDPWLTLKDENVGRIRNPTYSNAIFEADNATWTTPASLTANHVRSYSTSIESDATPPSVPHPPPGDLFRFPRDNMSPACRRGNRASRLARGRCGVKRTLRHRDGR